MSASCNLKLRKNPFLMTANLASRGIHNFVKTKRSIACSYSRNQSMLSHKDDKDPLRKEIFDNIFK